MLSLFTQVYITIETFMKVMISIEKYICCKPVIKAHHINTMHFVSLPEHAFNLQL